MVGWVAGRVDGAGVAEPGFVAGVGSDWAASDSAGNKAVSARLAAAKNRNGAEFCI